MKLRYRQRTRWVTSTSSHLPLSLRALEDTRSKTLRSGVLRLRHAESSDQARGKALNGRPFLTFEEQLQGSLLPGECKTIEVDGVRRCSMVERRSGPRLTAASTKRQVQDSLTPKSVCPAIPNISKFLPRSRSWTTCPVSEESAHL